MIEAKHISKWIHKLIAALLNRSDDNIVFVDWSRSNKPPISQAFANCRLVSAQAALLLQRMIDLNLARPELIYCIGNSFGGQMCGFFGRRFQPRIGRITSLDPSGIPFDLMGKKAALQKTDAQFIDVIHTTSASECNLLNLFEDTFGTGKMLGHLDFVVNNFRQGGCPDESIWDSVKNMDFWHFYTQVNLCKHYRAINLFILTLKEDPPCRYYGLLENEKEANISFDEMIELGINSQSFKHLIRSDISLRIDVKTKDYYPYC